MTNLNTAAKQYRLQLIKALTMFGNIGPTPYTLPNGILHHQIGMHHLPKMI